MNNNSHIIEGNIVDVVNSKIFKGRVHIENGTITSVEENHNITSELFILPGLIDAHIHIESSMLAPSEFARIAAIHGTVATVSDPHEIANVLGIKGVDFMIENGKKVPFKFFFGASSCVPATGFETAGASLGIKELEELMSRPEIHYMSEMMNYPGVIFDDPDVKAKLNIARKYGKPVDGHAPGLKGEDAEKYAKAGITTDHECFSAEEALDKIRFGMKILIREGSAAKNFEALAELYDQYPDKVMLCSDDLHPDDLMKGHINSIVKRAIHMDYDPVSVIRSCTLNPVEHYDLDVGLLQEGDDADIIVIDNLSDFNVLRTYIKGNLVAENGKPLIPRIDFEPINHFNAEKIQVQDIAVPAREGNIRVIQALDGQLITKPLVMPPKIEGNNVVADPGRDISKIVVYDRYHPSQPSVAFVTGFTLEKGAIGSTVAHDSHNIIIAGTNDADIVLAINLLIENKGGIVCVENQSSQIMPLPVGGLMADDKGETVAGKYEMLDSMAKSFGSTLRAPFMTLSFMALLVIPDLKISDKGLFDGQSFRFTDLFIN